MRSALFNAAFYLNTALQMIFWTPLYFTGSRKRAWWFVHFWSRSNLWLMKVIAGTRHEITGTENMPDHACIIAPKHQSSWDTFAFLPLLHDPVYILKRELMWVPLFGWYVGRMDMIPIDRGSREKAVLKVNAGAARAMADGRQLLIYPEGTRREAGAEPAYKAGIAHLYEKLGVPVVPVAHNAGLFWPRNSWLRHPGTIRSEILEPIPPGLSREAFMAALVERTEAACDRLLLQAADDPDGPPLRETARRRVDALRASRR